MNFTEGSQWYTGRKMMLAAKESSTASKQTVETLHLSVSGDGEDTKMMEYNGANNRSWGPAYIAESSDKMIVYTAIMLMLIIILFGLAGNIMVILAVKTTRKLQTVANVFVVNLSVCDLAFVTCVLPFSIYTYAAGGWYLQPALCKFIGFLGYTLTGTTLVNIAMIAWNRYQLVANSKDYASTFSRPHMVALVAVSWLLPVLVLTPALVEVWGRFGYVAMLATCNLLLSHDSQSFKLFLLVVRALIPCALILYCYIFIYRVTRASHRKMHKALSNPAHYDALQQRHEMHLTRMMIVIFVVFAVSYFPCTITGVIDWGTILSREFHMFCAISVYIGSALNPVIYGLMNHQFREAYITLLTCRTAPYLQQRARRKNKQPVLHMVKCDNAIKSGVPAEQIESLVWKSKEEDKVDVEDCNEECKSLVITQRLSQL